MRANQRGSTLSKVDERSRTRRKRQSTHQAGSPGSGTSHECPDVSDSVVKRIAYAMRTGSPVRSAKRFFYSLCSVKAPLKEVAAEESSDMYRPVGRGARRRFVKFVPQRDVLPAPPLDPVFAAAGRPPRLPRTLGPLMKAESVPWIGYDYRVTGTFLEDPVLRDFRLAREACARDGRRQLTDEEGLRFDNDRKLMLWFQQQDKITPSGWSLGDRIPPLFSTKIGTYDLSRTLNFHKKENLSISAMVHEHLLGLQEFLPPLDDELTADLIMNLS